MHLLHLQLGDLYIGNLIVKTNLQGGLTMVISLNLNNRSWRPFLPPSTFHVGHQVFRFTRYKWRLTKKNLPNEKSEAPLFCWFLVSAENKGNICFKMFDRLTPPKQGDDSENVIPTFIYTLQNPPLQQLHWIFQTQKKKSWPTLTSPKWFSTQTCLGFGVFQFICCKAFPSLGLSSHRHVHEAPWPPRSGVESERRFCEGFFGGKNGPKRSMYGIFSYIWSIFYGKMKVNIYHTWSVWDLVSRGVFFFPKASISAPTTFTTPDQCFVWRNRRGIQIRPAFQRHSPSSEGKPLHLGIANCPEFINWLQKVKRVK